ncbi:nicotinate-nucleotide adenylyltransferase [Algoriphagus marinus]|uniref:nicotinate-nucleotide adenylyltransferase n=1 Tax=Algoriphagus marinus TaxID=1925762 RepID=UPI00094B8CE1|nr:nicotinate-nucleotide adenylyltransferase [Algoriphagus marinus]
MKKIILALFAFGISIPLFAQVVTLPEVEVSAKNYKYLDDVNNSSAAQTVQLLERYATSYDVRDSEYYEDEYDKYFISFFIPKGKILAAYDDDGNLLRTIEKYENVKLPLAVSKAAAKEYPGWKITHDAYLVNYHSKLGVTKKEYKLVLEKGNNRIRIKTDENGNIL